MGVSVVACGDAPHYRLVPGASCLIESLCADPGRMIDEIGDGDRLVLALHRGEYDLPAVQKAARSVGVDPLGVQIFEISDGSDDEIDEATLAGLTARADAFAGSVPEQAKPTLAREVTRRGFLRRLTPFYVGAPLVDDKVCAADTGCTACVDVCPKNAYTWQAGRVIYDIDACVPCGLCVTSCPTDAIVNPVATPKMLEAQVRAVIAAFDDPVGIRFVCSRGVALQLSGWCDISVPCSSMVPASWLLACLLLGAAGATAIPCGESECSLALDFGAIQANDLAYSTLERSGLDPSIVGGETIGEPFAEFDIPNPFESHNTPDLITALASLAPRPVDVDHPAANLGVVEIDGATCTLCGQCAKACPTAALVESYDGDDVSMSFDPRLCVNCSQCVSTCPEIDRGAIAVIGRYDSDILGSGRQTLHEGLVAVCEICGKAIAPAPMMGRITEILGSGFEKTISVVGRRCLDCRGR